MLRADVAGDVAVRDNHAETVEIKPFGRRHMRHFLAKRPGLDGHFISDPGKAVDMGRSRAGDIDDNLGIDLLAGSQLHTADAAVFLQDFDHLDAKAEFRAVLARGIGEVLRRQGRVCHIAAIRPVERAADPVAVGRAEFRIIDPARRRETVQRIDRQLVQNGRLVPLLDRDIKVAAVLEMLVQIAVGLGPHHHAAAFLELRQRMPVGQPQIRLPVTPVMIAFPCEGGAVEGRVMHADDGA